MRKYDGFDDLKDIIQRFDAPADALYRADVHLARYETPSYDGYALVIFEKDGKLWEVNGSHCSCYGLEGQWEPEETSWEAIAMRRDPYLQKLAERKLRKQGV